jgi:hypothetical protein
MGRRMILGVAAGDGLAAGEDAELPVTSFQFKVKSKTPSLFNGKFETKL